MIALKKEAHDAIVKSGAIATQCATHIATSIQDHERTVDKKINGLRKFIRDDAADLAAFKEEIRLEMQQRKQWQEDRGNQLDEIHRDVKAISMVKLNGGPAIPLGEAIRELWIGTAGIRSWGKVAGSYHEWQEKTPLGRFTKTKIGRVFVRGGIAFLISASLDFIGLVQIDVAAATRWALQLIFKHGVTP